jgi:hypothetical protein
MIRQFASGAFEDEPEDESRIMSERLGKRLRRAPAYAVTAVLRLSHPRYRAELRLPAKAWGSDSSACDPIAPPVRATGVSDFDALPGRDAPAPALHASQLNDMIEDTRTHGLTMRPIELAKRLALASRSMCPMGTTVN